MVEGKPARLYELLGDKLVICRACPRYCRLGPGQVGFCGVRKNVDGILHLLVYGKIIAAHVDPIEKKPVMHFAPGARVLSIATTGCNWACKYCQNYDISQRRVVEGVDVTPEVVVSMAKRYRSDGIAYTYNEPAIFMEFAHDVGVLARKEGLINIFVTNGYWTPDSVKEAVDFLDAATVDFKGNGDPEFLRKFAGVPSPDPIYQTLIELRDKTRAHIEITDLVVPELGDKLDQARKLVRWIYDNFGPDIPIHFLRFHPDYNMLDLPATPINILEKHYELAKEEGMRYVYLGNVPGHPYENTFCPECLQIVVERYGFDILKWNLDEKNRCRFCGYPITIYGKPVPEALEHRRIF
ncbi:MAG: AmmeMemoRadiSam system radical SAM enzyme [Aigarchaeota archaeon]|nr:AmmeMemoRadiSam system radical SAM enzyme [Aigarchaeota archaeon]